MGEDNINIEEKSESIKHDIEDCYRGAIKYLELYNNALMRHAGNHRLYFSFFISKFKSLYYFTMVDRDMERETIDGDTLLLDEVNNWFNNGVASDHKKGIELFLAYGKSLFGTGILTFKK